MSRREIWNYDRVNLGMIEPQLARKGRFFEKWVTVLSPEWQREACVQIRRYQSRECDDGMLMDTSVSCWKNTEVRTVCQRFYDNNQTCRQGLVGAVAFERDVMFEDGIQRPMLQFCWLHPFYRGKGKLKRLWPEFEPRFGSFVVSEPRSHAMTRFLLSIGYIEPA